MHYMKIVLLKTESILPREMYGVMEYPSTSVRDFCDNQKIERYCHQ